VLSAECKSRLKKYIFLEKNRKTNDLMTLDRVLHPIFHRASCGWISTRYSTVSPLRLFVPLSGSEKAGTGGEAVEALAR